MATGGQQCAWQRAAAGADEPHHVWRCGFFSSSFDSCRNLLHHLTLHVRGRDQLWAVPLPSLHVRHPRGHQPRIRLVHVLRVGRSGPDVAGRLPVHAGPLPLSSADPSGAQAPAGEWLRVTGGHSAEHGRHLPHPDTVTSPDLETDPHRDSNRSGGGGTFLHKLAPRTAQHTGSRSHETREQERQHLTADSLGSSGAFLFLSSPLSCPSLYKWTVQCYCLLFQEENIWTFLLVEFASTRREKKIVIIKNKEKPLAE